MPRLPDSLAVLVERDFRLVFGAHAVSMLGDRMVTIALAFAVLELGGSAADIGLVSPARDPRGSNHAWRLASSDPCA